MHVPRLNFAGLLLLRLFLLDILIGLFEDLALVALLSRLEVSLIARALC